MIQAPVCVIPENIMKPLTLLTAEQQHAFLARLVMQAHADPADGLNMYAKHYAEEHSLESQAGMEDAI